MAAEAAKRSITTIEPTCRWSRWPTHGNDIAGLVAGAHRGEGLGNQFLANIRETDAIVVWSGFAEIRTLSIPKAGSLADIEMIETELIYADLVQAELLLERVARTTKSGNRRAVAETQRLGQLIEALPSDRPARTVPPQPTRPMHLRCCNL